MLNRKSLARLLVDGRRRRKKRGGKAELARPSLGFRHIAIIGRGRVACNVAAINRPALGFGLTILIGKLDREFSGKFPFFIGL